MGIFGNLFGSKNNSRDQIFTFNIVDKLECSENFDRIIDQFFEQLGETEVSELTDIKARTLYFISTMHYQVLNGGVIQFVDNSSGDFFEDIYQTLDNLSLTAFVQILTDVRNKFPNQSIPTDMSERRNLIDKINEQAEVDDKEDELELFWEELDQKYYDNSKTLYCKVVEYIAR